MSLAKKSFIYTLGRILPQAVGFILLPVYTSYLSTEEYGIVESMYVITLIFTIFFSMASERSMFRLFYDYTDDSQKKKFIGNTFFLILFFSSLFLFIALIFSSTISKIFGSIPFNPFYFYAILTSFVMALSFIPITIFQIKEKALNFFTLTVSTFLVVVAFSLFYLIYKDEGALGLIKGRFYGSLVFVPIYAFIIFKESIFKVDKQIIRNILSFSLPMIPILLSAWVLNMVNRVFIEQYFSLEEVGIFSLSFKIASLGTIVVGGIFTAYNPVFYRLANSKEKGGSSINQLKDLNKIIILLMVFFCFSIIFVSKEVVLLFFSKSYHEAIYIIPLIMISILLTQIGGLLNLMIYQNKKPVVIMYISVVGALSCIVFNFLLVPKWGMVGAALASIVSSALILWTKNYYAKKTFYITTPIFKGVLVFLFLTLIVMIDVFLSINEFLSLGLKSCILLVVIMFVYKKYKDKFLEFAK